MKVKLPKKLRVYFIPEEGCEEGVSASHNTHEVEVQVLDDSKLVLWFTDQSKKRLWRNERLLNPGLVLMTEEIKEDENGR